MFCHSKSVRQFLLLMSRESHLPALFQLFRQQGYDGVSLANISEATGLGKASLYHHFPGGKAEMVQATLAYSQAWFEENVLRVLMQDKPVQERLREMCDRLDTLYESGEQPCLMAALIAGAPRDALQMQVRDRLESLVGAIATMLTAAGLSKTIAKERGEDAVIAIQGALILSQGTGNSKPFTRILSQLPDRLCEGLPAV